MHFLRRLGGIQLVTKTSKRRYVQKTPQIGTYPLPYVHSEPTTGSPRILPNGSHHPGAWVAFLIEFNSWGPSSVTASLRTIWSSLISNVIPAVRQGRGTLQTTEPTPTDLTTPFVFLRFSGVFFGNMVWWWRLGSWDFHSWRMGSQDI